MTYLDADCLEVDRSQFVPKFVILDLVDFVAESRRFQYVSLIGDQHCDHIAEKIDMRHPYAFV